MGRLGPGYSGFYMVQMVLMTQSLSLSVENCGEQKPMVCIRMSKACVRIGLIIGLLSVVACDERRVPAPVVDAHWRASSRAEKHRVMAGETLYAIAFRYDLDYRQLAGMNHIPSPYALAVGQVLVVKTPTHSAVPYVNSKLRPVRSYQARKLNHVQPAQRNRQPWIWPTRGRVITSFIPQLEQKGIDIAGKPGQVIRAAQAGMVAYAGDGLPGYGNLILIQHNRHMMSAYAYNARNWVHVGQRVHSGQALATMGLDPHHRYAVHFEIRQYGKAVNPQSYLP